MENAEKLKSDSEFLTAKFAEEREVKVRVKGTECGSTEMAPRNRVARKSRPMSGAHRATAGAIWDEGLRESDRPAPLTR